MTTKELQKKLNELEKLHGNRDVVITLSLDGLTWEYGDISSVSLVSVGVEGDKVELLGFAQGSEVEKG